MRDEVVEPDEQFCADYRAQLLQDVVGGFTLNYDDTQLQFNQVTNLNTRTCLTSPLNNNIATPRLSPAGMLP